MTARALFLRDDTDSYVATHFSQGPWDPGAASGGAVLGLLGHCLEDVATLVPMTLARMTADLMRPVPLGRPLTVTSEVVREGRKIQLVDLHLRVDGVLYARASVLRLRDADLTAHGGLPTGTPADIPPQLAPPDEAVSLRESAPDAGGFLDGVDMRHAPRLDGPGDGMWVRLTVPVIAGEPVRSTARTALAFDCANNAGADFGARTASAINPDVSAHVLRPPTGEWLALTGLTRFAPALGRGVSAVTLSDVDGAVAEVTICQLVQPLPR
jgi:hypothetical protein